MIDKRQPDRPSASLSLTALAGAAKVQTEFLIELVDEGVLVPHGGHPDDWQFDVQCLKQVRVVRSLQCDLGVNLAGAALALELLNEIHTLRAQLHHNRHPRRS